ncbi:MAG: sulfatase [Planctomycetaceae bacterium]|nr:sulfatase [Planctomycetaceae bacterium]
MRSTAVVIRSQALRSLALLATCLALLGAGGRGLRAAEPPNILFVFADDWGRYASAYAALDGPGTPNDIVRTPHFDRVAREGVLFRNAFVNAPSCTPCRSSLLTGQYFWRTGRGAILRGAVWDERLPAFPLLLRDSGYQIGKAFKVWSPGQPADAPFGGQQYAFNQRGGRFNQFSQNATQLVAQGMPVAAAKEQLLKEVSGNFAQFLDASGDRPFCFWLGPTNVHRRWQQGSGQALWGIDPAQLQGKLPPFLPDVPEVREDFADYLGEVQALDALLGAALAELERRGKLDTTMIVVSGDHGPPGFTHGKCNLYDFGTAVPLAIRGPGIAGGRVVDDLISLPDLAPTFLEWAGVERPADMTARSLAPLLHSTRSGQVDPDRTWVVSGRERHVDTARAGLTPYPQRALRTTEYLYIINFAPDRWPLGDPARLDGAEDPNQASLVANTHVTLADMDAGPTKAWLVAHRREVEGKRYFDLAFGQRPREELYVLATDPHQMRNVAADPQYAAVRERLEEQLLSELKRTGDGRVTGDGQTFERPPFAGQGSGEESRPRRNPNRRAAN